MEKRFVENLKQMTNDVNDTKVFKYREINENTFKILSNHQVWFANPSTFNDPFDCNIRVDMADDSSKIKNYYNKYNKEYKFDNNDNWILLKKSNFKDISLGNKLVMDSVKRMVSKVGILSLSSKNDNILMWSHYSNDHKGICLEFDLLKGKEAFRPIKKMKYKDEYGVLRYLDNPNRVIEEIFLSKSIEWKYEDELRVISNKVGLKSYNKDALSAIYFGCKTEEKDIDKIIKIVNDNFPEDQVQFYRMILDDRRYNLLPIEIT